MHITDTIHLGWTSLRAHPGRNLFTVGAIGTLFCLIFTAQLWFQGLQNQYITAAGTKTNSAVIISANPQIGYSANFDENGNYIGTTLSFEEISQDITANGGTIIDMTSSDIPLPANLLSNSIPVTVPNDTTPIMINTYTALKLTNHECPRQPKSTTDKLAFYQDVREQTIGKTFEQNGTKYTVIDFAPDNFCTTNLSFKNLDRKNTSIFNPLLELFFTPDSQNIIIQNNISNQKGESPEIIATFPDAETVYHYLLNGHGYFSMVDIPGRKIDYSVTVLAGISPEIIVTFKMIGFFLNIGCIILAIITTIIIIFTSVRLINQDKQIIKLYHHFGATKRQIQLVYLVYFFELVISAVILSFSLASIITILYSICNQTNLSALFALSFSLSEMPYVILWGMNLEIIIFATTPLLLPSICILINSKQFNQ